VKKAEDTNDIVFRLHEGHGDTVDATLTLGFKTKNAMECDLMEADVKPLKMAKDKLQLRFKPFEIKTVRFELKAGKKK
jgi:alpha-mannosidase